MLEMIIIYHGSHLQPRRDKATGILIVRHIKKTQHISYELKKLNLSLQSFEI